MYLCSLLVAAVASILVSGQAQSTSECTSNSFELPSWLIDDFNSAAGKVSLHISNRATNYTADLTCSSGDNDWYACSIQGKQWSNDTLQVSVQAYETTAQVFVNQTWTCDDRNGTKVLPFIAVGNNSIALNSGGRAIQLPLLIKGSLLSPIAITPKYSGGPTGYDKPGCAAPQNASWILNAPFYTNQTGDGITSMPFQSFNVLITNVATGYQTGCMPDPGSDDSLLSTPGTPLPLRCAGYEFQSPSNGRYTISTNATFDPSTFRFNMNQTWYCDDTTPAKPMQITASVSDILPLTCNSVSIDTEDSPSSIRTSCINPGDVALASQILSEIPLPPYSIEDPVPGPDGCTLSSIFHPEWTFSSFEVDSNGSNISSVSFNIMLQTGNPGYQFPISISQGPAALEGDTSWFLCAIGPDGNIGQPLWPTACSLKYQPATRELTLKADWACNELDPEHPVLFSGVTTTTVDSPLSCETVEGVSQCVTANGAYSWTASIRNVSWHQMTSVNKVE